MNFIPHQLSDKSVRRFVPVISRVLEQHRKRGAASCSFNPLGMGLNTKTAIARLRDAVHSLSMGLTSHPSVNADELKAVWPQYKVTSSDGQDVQVVPRETEQGEPPLLIHGSSTSLAVLQTDAPRFVETLTAFAVLLGQRFLQGQVEIQGDLSEHLRHTLESGNDIVFIQDGQNLYHMI